MEYISFGSAIIRCLGQTAAGPDRVSLIRQSRSTKQSRTNMCCLHSQEYIRQSREQQLNDLDKQEPAEKKASKSASRSRSNSSPSMNSGHFDVANAATTPCYVPGGELLPILIRNERSMSPPNGDAYHTNIYTVDNEPMPEMCDSACQTRESLFTTQGYSSGNSTPNHSVHTNSPPAPFSTFGYKKDAKFKAEAKIEVAPRKGKFDDKRRPYSLLNAEWEPYKRRHPRQFLRTTEKTLDGERDVETQTYDADFCTSRSLPPVVWSDNEAVRFRSWINLGCVLRSAGGPRRLDVCSIQNEHPPPVSCTLYVCKLQMFHENEKTARRDLYAFLALAVLENASTFHEGPKRSVSPGIPRLRAAVLVVSLVAVAAPTWRVQLEDVLEDSSGINRTLIGKTSTPLVVMNDSITSARPDTIFFSYPRVMDATKALPVRLKCSF
ncbi:hypothetical protein GEV33_012521 [Tenebrio molitor]|uniref:Uncharacterized protein n=1 Tax=Tenebrio molitor TaxID=7067 RepID=A0A8J6H9E0_TENMO|nr:hypothetical protein GEV33_012521 [Tenebrio molitor]